ncbi:MAG TPA: c-type cytochrome [Vicinamibacterales bacterium]|nr:c-type cytochrome [Vicinamibacterales bacterium]
MGVLGVLGVLLAPVAHAQQPLPPGPGLDVLNKRCVTCHEADIISSQKLSLTGWTRSVDKMVRWGAMITPDERDVLQPYLAQHFAPRPVASHAATGLPAEASAKAGAATFKRVCLTCHEADIIEQQKLTPTGWTRSVEKMMRWGAAVSDADKQPLVDYLAARFGPR